MSTTAWWALLGMALVIGAILGSWVVLRQARVRFGAQLQRATDALNERHAATTEQLRAAQARAQAELEQSRISFKRQLALMAADSRAPRWSAPRIA
jgi:uncharacterized membrane-anchored protein YhcB (DUF1043 family)